MKETKHKTIKMLEYVAERVPGCIIRTSSGGVPHIVVDSFYSVAYFCSRKNFSVFSGYATPNNKRIAVVSTREEVVNLLLTLQAGVK